MAEIHVLDGGFRNGIETKRLVFHYDLSAFIAGETSLNLANITQDPNVSGFVSVVPDISAGELSDIQAGTVVERVESMEIHESADNATLIARAYQVKDSLLSEVQSQFKAKYRNYLATPARPA